MNRRIAIQCDGGGDEDGRRRRWCEHSKRQSISVRLSLDYINARLSTFAIFHFAFTHFLSFVVGSFCSFFHCAHCLCAQCSTSSPFVVFCVRFIFFLRISLWFYYYFYHFSNFRCDALFFGGSGSAPCARFSLFLLLLLLPFSYLFMYRFLALFFCFFASALFFTWASCTPRYTLDRYRRFVRSFFVIIIAIVGCWCVYVRYVTVRIEWIVAHARQCECVCKGRKSNFSGIDYIWNGSMGKMKSLMRRVHRSWFSKRYAKL